MAVNRWVGTISTDGGIAGNWSLGSLPTSSDDIYFDAAATKDCAFDTGAVSQVAKIIVAFDFIKTLTFSTGTLTCESLEIQKANRINVTGTTTIAFFDSAYDFTNSYIKINSANDTTLNTSTVGVFTTEAARALMTFTMTVLGTSSSLGLKFDDGVYPNVKLEAPSTAYFFPTYLTPNNTYAKVDMTSVDFAANVTASITGVTILEIDYDKVFVFGAFTCLSNSFDMGFSTVHFKGTSAPFSLPVDGNTAYGSSNSFSARMHSIVIDAGAAATDYVLLPAGSTLSCNSLEIADGANFFGPAIDPGSQIFLIERPKIRGSWNYKQIADGHFRSLNTHGVLGVPQGGTGNSIFTDGRILFGRGNAAVATNAGLAFNTATSRLTLNGTIGGVDGVIFDEQASTPIPAAAATGIIYVKNTSPSTLIFVSDTGAETTVA